MSVSSQENQSQDFQVEQAIAEGRRQANEVELELEVTLEFTDAEQKMLKKLAAALALSATVLLESAISYVYFLHKEDKNILKKIKEYSKHHNQAAKESKDKIEESPKRSKPYTINLALALETSYKLEQMGIKNKINECVIMGINLLHKRLIDNEQKSANE